MVLRIGPIRGYLSRVIGLLRWFGPKDIYGILDALEAVLADRFNRVVEVFGHL
jgi:hypothetical protein